jgi:hypothetical protein
MNSKEESSSSGSLRRDDVAKPKKLFVAYTFNARTAWIPNHLIPILTSYNFKVYAGPNYAGQSVSRGIATTLAEVDLVLAFLTKRLKLQNKNAWTASEWIIQELTYALAKEKSVFVVKERDVQFEMGLLGDPQILQLDFRNPLPCFVAIRDALVPPQSDTLSGLTVRHIARSSGTEDSRDWWDFWVWVDGPGHLLNAIEHVKYTLHETFPAGERTQRINDRNVSFGFAAETDDEFHIQVEIVSHDGSKRNLRHELKLFLPDGTRP